MSLAELQPDFDNAVLLGYRETGEPRIAVPVAAAEDRLASHYKLADARTLYRDHLLDEELLSEVAQAVSLTHWNADNRFCGKCGGTMGCASAATSVSAPPAITRFFPHRSRRHHDDDRYRA